MRYFYTCPIKAAYMVKHFDMIMLNYGVTKEDSAEKLCALLDDGGYGNGKIYIDPLSYDVLKPQVGDLITINNGKSASLITHEEFLEVMERMRPQLEAPPKIIQRQNKTWFTPETEE